MASFYRQQVGELYTSLQGESEAKRLQAGEIIRSLVKEIILTPSDGEMSSDVRGDLAGILTIASGTGSNIPVQKHKSRPYGVAEVRDIVSQFEMDAGVRFDLTTFGL